MKGNSLFITIIVAIIVGAGAFFGGMKYQQSKTPAGFGGGQFARTFGGANGQRRGGGAFGGGVIGDITSVDNDSITVKMQDGSSKIVILSGSTAINKQATGSKSDLTTGERVAVFGTTNSDGSVTAQNIQLNPLMRQRPSPSTTQ